VEDWMDAGGAAPGHFDRIAEEHTVRGTKQAHTHSENARRET